MLEEKKKNKIINIESKKRLTLTLGVLLVLIGLILVTSNYIDTKINNAYNNLNLEILAMNEEVKEIDEGELMEQEVEEPEEKVEVKPVINYNYVASLSIPKINLNRGLVAIDSPYNDINYNIKTLKESNYPNVDKGNFILAAHRGTSSISFFARLFQLSLGDKCYVNYNGKTYTYRITDIYDVPKTGYLVINRDYDKTTLTLITCKYQSNTEQTVYIAELINVE